VFEAPERREKSERIIDKAIVVEPAHPANAPVSLVREPGYEPETASRSTRWQKGTASRTVQPTCRKKWKSGNRGTPMRAGLRSSRLCRSDWTGCDDRPG